MKKMIKKVGLSTVRSNAVVRVREWSYCKKNKSQVKKTDQDDHGSLGSFCEQGLSNGFFIFDLDGLTFSKQRSTWLADFVSNESQLVKGADPLRKNIERVAAERRKLTVCLDGYTDPDQYNQVLW